MPPTKPQNRLCSISTLNPFHPSTGSSTINKPLATRFNCPVSRGIAVQFPLESLSKCGGIRTLADRPRATDPLRREPNARTLNAMPEPAPQRLSPNPTRHPYPSRPENYFRHGAHKGCNHPLQCSSSYRPRGRNTPRSPLLAVAMSRDRCQPPRRLGSPADATAVIRQGGSVSKALGLQPSALRPPSSVLSPQHSALSTRSPPPTPTKPPIDPLTP